MTAEDTEVTKVGQVFGVKKAYELVNYIEREGVDNVFIEALDDGKHVALFGASKTGKSSLLEQHVGEQEKLYLQCSHKWAFKDFVDALLNAAYGHSDTDIVPDDGTGRMVSAKTGITIDTKVIEASLKRDFTKKGQKIFRKIDKSKYVLTNHTDLVRFFQDLGYGKAAGKSSMLYIVIDDFHRLDTLTQEEVASVAKMVFDNANVVFICVGIWAEENKLSSLCSELMGRCVDVNCNLWPAQCLMEVIGKGSDLLNIEFPDGFAEAVAKSAHGSVFIVQEACAEACRHLGIREAFPTKITIDKTINADLIVKRVTERDCNFTDFHNKILALRESDYPVLYVYAAMLSLTTGASPAVDMTRMQQKIEELFPTKTFGRHFAHNACTQFASLARERNFGKLFDFYRDTDGRFRFKLVDSTFKFWLKGRRSHFLNDVKDRLEGGRTPPQPGLQFDI